MRGPLLAELVKTEPAETTPANGQATREQLTMADKLAGICIVLVFLLVEVATDVVLPPEIIQEISDNKDDVNKIISYVLDGDAKHKAIRRLESLTDDFGPRSTGSQALEEAIDYLIETLNKEGFTNVKGEDVTANKWVRNEESLYMMEPRTNKLSLMSLGSSVGTEGTLTANVVVVRDFDDLDEKYRQNRTFFNGKIVLYNEVWRGYSQTVEYRTTGAWRAAQYGAVAALIASVTDFSIYSPHTGIQTYNSSVKPIPVAAITVEDANQMQRYYDRGISILVNLTMNCENLGSITTRNVVAELKGSQKPDELVIFGGHIDSWDVGYGVMDDGGGVVITWQALSILKELNLTPKRTLRAVFWTSEEIGLVGAEQYYERHQNESDAISLIMESDYGTFKPFGIGFTGSSSARAIMKEILSLLASVEATGVDQSGSSPDIDIWINSKGVPGANLWNDNGKYFYYHHSHGDSITMQDPDDLDLCVIVWTVVAYVVANLENKLPRDDPYSSGASPIADDCNFRLLIWCLVFVFVLRRFTT